MNDDEAEGLNAVEGHICELHDRQVTRLAGQGATLLAAVLNIPEDERQQVVH